MASTKYRSPSIQAHGLADIVVLGSWEGQSGLLVTVENRANSPAEKALLAKKPSKCWLNLLPIASWIRHMTSGITALPRGQSCPTLSMLCFTTLVCLHLTARWRGVILPSVNQQTS